MTFCYNVKLSLRQFRRFFTRRLNCYHTPMCWIYSRIIYTDSVHYLKGARCRTRSGNSLCLVIDALKAICVFQGSIWSVLFYQTDICQKALTLCVVDCVSLNHNVILQQTTEKVHNYCKNCSFYNT